MGTEDCPAIPVADADSGKQWLDYTSQTAGAFNSSFGEASENYCTNGTCMQMLGSWVGSLFGMGAAANQTNGADMNTMDMNNTWDSWGNATLGNETWGNASWFADSAWSSSG